MGNLPLAQQMCRTMRHRLRNGISSHLAFLACEFIEPVWHLPDRSYLEVRTYIGLVQLMDAPAMAPNVAATLALGKYTAGVRESDAHNSWRLTLPSGDRRWVPPSRPEQGQSLSERLRQARICRKRRLIAPARLELLRRDGGCSHNDATPTEYPLLAQPRPNRRSILS